jgi:transposase
MVMAWRPSTKWVSRYALADVRRALARLPFEERAALVLHEVEGLPCTEIARMLEISPTAVETLIFDARRALSEQLAAAVTCNEAERAISRNLDGLLDRAGRRALRGHVRACSRCERLDHSQRIQRKAWRALSEAPLPRSLQSFVPS